MPAITCEELSEVWTLKQSLAMEQRRLIDLRSLAEPSTPILDGMPHVQPLTFKVERIAGLMIDCQQLIEKLEQEIAQRKFELLTKLQAVKINEIQQRVLSYRYVACLKFNEIAKAMNFTYVYIHILHRKGLKSLGLTNDEMAKLKKLSFVASK